jgi:hypothetical protein
MGAVADGVDRAAFDHRYVDGRPELTEVVRTRQDRSVDPG